MPTGPRWISVLDLEKGHIPVMRSACRLKQGHALWIAAHVCECPVLPKVMRSTNIANEGSQPISDDSIATATRSHFRKQHRGVFSNKEAVRALTGINHTLQDEVLMNVSNGSSVWNEPSHRVCQH